MEVLGGIAGVVSMIETGLRLSKATYGLLADLKNAPGLIHALKNEVTDIGGVLTHVEDTIKGTEASGTTPTSIRLLVDLEKQLEIARIILNDLNIVAQKLVVKTRQRGRFGWHRKRPHIIDLQRKLKEVRRKIIELLVTHNSSNSARILLEVRGVHCAIQESQSTIKEKLDKNSQILNDQLLAVRQASKQGKVQISAMIQPPNVTLAPPTPGWPPPTVDQFYDGLARKNGVNGRLERPSLITKPYESPSDSQPDSLYRDSGLFISLGLRGRRCGSNCRCSCHSPSHSQMAWRLPHYMHRIVGSLFLGYTGYPTSEPTCDLQDCLNGRYLRLSLVYSFPLWFASYTFQTLMEASTSGFKFAFLPRRHVEFFRSQESLLYQACKGTLSAVRQILQTDRTTLLDVDNQYGWCALSRALRGGHYSNERIEIIRTLLVAGANPDQEDDVGISPAQYAASLIVLQDGEPEFLAGLARLFPVASRLDDMDFTYLHKLVLKYCKVDLVAALQSSSPEILAHVNTRDCFGRTPLLYAANQGDVDSVQALLDAGASLHEKDANGLSAMHYAASSTLETHVRLIDLLLAAGADKNSTDARGFTVVHAAARRNASITLRKLLDAGASTDYRSTHLGLTPALYAARFDSADAIRALEEYGADLDTPDNYFRRSPLILAVLSNSHKAQAVLLSLGADYRWVTRNGWTILHHAAAFGDERILKQLMEFGLRGVDPNVTADEGRTARELFEERQDLTDSLRSAFAQLIEVLRENQPSDRDGGDCEDTDEEANEEFVDAYEHINNE